MSPFIVTISRTLLELLHQRCWIKKVSFPLSHLICPDVDLLGQPVTWGTERSSNVPGLHHLHQVGYDLLTKRVSAINVRHIPRYSDITLCFTRTTFFFLKINRRFFFLFNFQAFLPKRTLVKSPEIRLCGLGEDYFLVSPHSTGQTIMSFLWQR